MVSPTQSPLTKAIQETNPVLPKINLMQSVTLDEKTTFPNILAEQQPTVKNQLKTGWNTFSSYLSRIGPGGP